MPDKTQKKPDNASGQFYVDHECVDCDLCRQASPTNFTRNEELGYSYVFKQPENEQEVEKCKEAALDCPVEAIGSDGDS